MGLFTGMSLLSICEVAVFLAKGVLSKIRGACVRGGK